MIASREANLAAIDRISFSLERHAAPDDVQGVSIIGRITSHPAIAFVADAGLPEQVFGKLRAAILAFRKEPSWLGLKSLLSVSDITVLDPACYAPMASFAV